MNKKNTIFIFCDFDNVPQIVNHLPLVIGYHKIDPQNIHLYGCRVTSRQQQQMEKDKVNFTEEMGKSLALLGRLPL